MNLLLIKFVRWLAIQLGLEESDLVVRVISFVHDFFCVAIVVAAACVGLAALIEAVRSAYRSLGRR